MSELEHKETMQALTLPTMALRGITVFPSMLLHFDVGRQTSIKALDQAVELGSYLFLIPQKDLSVDDPELSRPVQHRHHRCRPAGAAPARG